mmetsp:Transcript_47152/g.86546  ORF Transcript_47152/g.86546 Transcript_47152/m.86546 type:complete len:454 (-) Transcript_47152:33-1394(-)
MGCLRLRGASLDSLGGHNVAAPEPKQRFVGLLNHGATCYLNCVVQVLFMTPEFKEVLKECETEARTQALAYALQRLFSDLSSSVSACSTTSILSALHWRANRQQDAHDAWLQLCDLLETELKQTPHSKLVENLFQGERCNCVRCHVCGNVSQTKDSFTSLEVTVPLEHVETTVLGGLQEHLRPEEMYGDKQYDCDHCKCKVDAVRFVSLASLPPILTVHLQRFTMKAVSKFGLCSRRSSFDVVKVNSRVHFDTYLDLRDFVTAVEPPSVEENDKAEDSAQKGVAGTKPVVYGKGQEEDSDNTNLSTAASPDSTSGLQNRPLACPCPRHTPAGAQEQDAENSAEPNDSAAKNGNGNGNGKEHPIRQHSLIYELYAVLLHSGTPQTGHYQAFIKDVDSGAWLLFNDEEVRVLQDLQKELQQRAFGGRGTTSAYILLYRALSKADAEALKLTTVSP